MAVYDLINGHQVQCFKNSLTDYKNGDEVPLKTKSYLYDDNVAIIDTLNPVIKPFEKMVHLIKESKIEGSYQVGSLIQENCSDIQSYYTDTGRKLNIYSYNDIVKFLYDEYKLQLDIDFVNIYYRNNDEVYKQIEKLESEFYSKWYK